MPAITKTVTTNAGYACDMCGDVISDGTHDGAGGVNWWGLSFDIVPIGTEVATVERVWNGCRVTIREKDFAQPETWGLCRKCAGLVREFIVARLLPAGGGAR